MARQLSTVITSVGAGTVQSVTHDGYPARVYIIKADNGNGDTVYVGNDGSDTVSPTTGQSYAAGEGFATNEIGGLHVHFVANGDKLSILAVT